PRLERVRVPDTFPRERVVLGELHLLRTRLDDLLGEVAAVIERSPAPEEGWLRVEEAARLARRARSAAAGAGPVRPGGVGPAGAAGARACRCAPRRVHGVCLRRRLGAHPAGLTPSGGAWWMGSSRPIWSRSGGGARRR